MKYTPKGETIPQNMRQDLNEKILYLIRNNRADEFGITPEDIYNAYTGSGGLHGLNRSDYDSYSEYSEAKKEMENGQFFTPPAICRFIAETLSPSKEDSVASLTCGTGSFFNFFPSESSLYGCEIDGKAYTVARYLYPNANIVNEDIRLNEPGILFDYIVGNPPFHLSWYLEDGTEMVSQLYYCVKAYQLLKPYGIMAVITPVSFLADSFSDSRMIAEMESRFWFLGQAALPEDAFKAMGIAAFPTKIQFWQKKGEGSRIVMPYETVCAKDLPESFSERLSAARQRLSDNRFRFILDLARNKAVSEQFQYQTEKMLYQIKVHPRLSGYYSRFLAYLQRFYTEKKPDAMEYEQWCRVRLTEAKVLSYLKRTLKKQNDKPPADIIALVKRDYDFVYKSYSAAARQRMTARMKTPVPIYQVVSTDGDSGFTCYARLIRRKQREYTIQNQPFADMEEAPDIAAWLDSFSLWDAENEMEIRLNDLQKHDISLMLQKKYGLLQWEQGSGKTLAGIAVALYRMERERIHHTWVVSSAISIRNNWNVVLANYGLSYVFVERLKDFERIRCGDIVIMTLNALRKYRKQVKRWIRRYNQKVQLIFDESDEMTNTNGMTTKACLDCFRRCRCKLLTTGTSTRNNISEFAPQLELLYNNSVNMLSWCPEIYRRSRDSDTLVSEHNPYFGQPIPAYKKGYSLFSASHLPERITVFGVEERTQDIYNADALNEILGKTVITRTFEEITDREIRRIHQVPVSFSEPERAVYQHAIERFYEMRWNYFQSTGNYKKDSMMQLIQQIVLLLRVSAAPNTVAEYTGGLPTKLRKVVDMVREWDKEIVAIGVRHKVVLDTYKEALKAAFPDRPLFVVTGATTTFAKRRALRQTLNESGNGILLCTQQSLPSSVNFEYVNKIIIPELHYNNSRMSQFYMRFVRYTSTEWKDIYFVTYAGSIESNQMQMVLAKEKINLFMKGQDTDLNAIYEKFGVDYDLLSLLMHREEDAEGRFHIRWGEQQIA